jgi:hypothetical protein
MNTSIKTGLQALVHQARRDQEVFLADLTDAERAAFGTSDHWSIRDHINHSNFWRERLLHFFTAMQTHVPLTPITDFEAVNQAIFAERRNLSWDAILADSTRLMDAIATGLAAMSETDLTDPTRFVIPNAGTLQSRVIHFAYEHPLSHYVQVQRERGDHDGAVSQQQEAIKLTEQLFGKGEAYFILVYNLACLQAILGEAEHAMTTLRNVFAGLPPEQQAEWRVTAREDSELISLRNLPAFQALTNDEPLQ